MKVAPQKIRNKTKTVSLQETFVKNLLLWNERHNTREMPWKGEKDPYKIWVSEVILQQTKVDQGRVYYQNFIKAFPDIRTLANAPEKEVFKLWEGLGYYSRCRNLIHTAQHIFFDLKGAFPVNYHSLLQLKGVGTYTAAAIASFAYNQHHAVLDGNVYRVLSRVFGVTKPVDSLEGKKYFGFLAQIILPAGKAGVYNQAVMDFGALVCKPIPDCDSCFAQQFCRAYHFQTQLTLPVKEKKLSISERWLNFVVLKYKDEVAISQRTVMDIWRGLYQVSLIETKKAAGQKKILQLAAKRYGLSQYKVASALTAKKQRLTHQLIFFTFMILEIEERVQEEELQWVPISKLQDFPFPNRIRAYLDDQFVSF